MVPEAGLVPGSFHSHENYQQNAVSNIAACVLWSCPQTTNKQLCLLRTCARRFAEPGVAVRRDLRDQKTPGVGSATDHQGLWVQLVNPVPRGVEPLGNGVLWAPLHPRPLGHEVIQVPLRLRPLDLVRGPWPPNDRAIVYFK